MLSFPVFGQYSPEFSPDCNQTNDVIDPVYEYNNTVMNRTIVTDFDLVCSRKWIDSLLISLTFVGYTGGSALGYVYVN